MQLIDRYILTRFLSNFVILFSLLYFFAVAIDLILNLDEFVDTARGESGEDTGRLRQLMIFVGLIIDYQAPRFFQLYAFLHGLLAIGAMGFTLAQMHKFRELVAVLASGVSLQRIAMPFIAGMFLISLAQLANQEFFLPRVAPLLLRSHSNIGKSGLDSFPVSFAKDGKGNLLQAAQFDPRTNRLHYPTFLQRTQLGITTVCPGRGYGTTASTDDLRGPDHRLSGSEVFPALCLSAWAPGHRGDGVHPRADAQIPRTRRGPRFGGEPAADRHAFHRGNVPDQPRPACQSGTCPG